MRRHLSLAILGVLVAGGAIAATPALLSSSGGTPGGAVAGATASAPATPSGGLQQPDPSSNSGLGNGLGNGLGAPAGSHGRQPPPVAPSPATLTGYVWPLPNGRITNAFGPNYYSDTSVNGIRFHDGLDLATYCGDRVVAAHDGLVLAAGRKVDPWMGWIGSLAPSVARRNQLNLWGELPIVVVIDDRNGYRSIYAHFSKEVVKAGQTVQAGEFLGWEGRTGFATGCHLHYGLFSPWDTDRFGLRADVAKRTKLPLWEIARINPLLVLPTRPVVSPSPSLSPSASDSPGSSPSSGSRVDPLVAASDQRPGRQPAE